MPSVQERTVLYARLEEVLGRKPAEILMQELTPHDGLATKADLINLGDGLNERIDSLESRLDARIDGLDARMGGLETRMGGLETRMDGLDTRMDGLDTRMGRLETHMERFDDRLHDFHGALREQTRHFILASTGTMVALTGMAFGAALLV